MQVKTDSIYHESENSQDGQIKKLKRELDLLEKKMLHVLALHQDNLQQIHPAQESGFKNLLFYLALRSEDIRDLQNRLHISGLSSLASSESHIFSQLQAIQERLGKIISAEDKFTFNYENAVSDMRQKGHALFGMKQEPTVPYIMVTMDQHCAEDYSKIKELLMTGMNVARINCAHDDETVWGEMIRHIRRATAETGLSCKVYMDLAGPKIRTVLPGKKGEKHKIEVKEGERIYLAEGEVDHPEKVAGCTIRDISRQLQVGERVLFDDGSIECRVESMEEDKAVLRVVRVSRDKPFIKDEKGINFPDSKLTISSLTDFDMECLPFICQHADLIGYSFVRSSGDLEKLQEQLRSRRVKELFVIIKIETQEAVQNLPALLIQGMQEKVFGVMIARGDLAIEVGFERLSEIQEEILWICEAAHVPVIWATQVLDTLNKSGLATRSEITDAAYSGKAECVMINKGKHTIEVIETLKDILLRGGGHHIKKRYTFRPLNIAKAYLESLVD